MVTIPPSAGNFSIVGLTWMGSARNAEILVFQFAFVCDGDQITLAIQWHYWKSRIDHLKYQDVVDVCPLLPNHNRTLGKQCSSVCLLMAPHHYTCGGCRGPCIYFNGGFGRLFASALCFIFLPCVLHSGDPNLLPRPICQSSWRSLAAFFGSMDLLPLILQYTFPTSCSSGGALVVVLG
ncbi:hypothetical protein Tco_0424079 [Tanacetum coccineum]